MRSEGRRAGRSQDVFFNGLLSPPPPYGYHGTAHFNASVAGHNRTLDPEQEEQVGPRCLT